MGKIKEYLRERLIILGDSTPGEWKTWNEEGWVETDEFIVVECADPIEADVSNACAIADAHNELPRILSSLVSILELHKPEEFSDCLTGEAGTVCSECFDVDANAYTKYPCRTVQTIAKELGVGTYYG